jgi:large subunit ribosomal protein L22
MGERKRLTAERRKEERKTTYMARLVNCPTSPRKMRLVADQIRGQNVELALHMLKASPKEAAIRLRKLLLSAIANWQGKNEGVRIEDASLYIKMIRVDSARMIKRIQPAPQGRAHRIRKHSNHVTMVIDSWQAVEEPQEVETAGELEVEEQQ